jgi:Na+/glutamate symporter
VGTWEIIYFKFMPHFMDDYGAHQIAKLQESGASAAAVQAKIAEVNKTKENYNNPLINSAMTFIEPFPVGLLITLISAGILRRKRQPQTAGATATTA